MHAERKPRGWLIEIMERKETGMDEKNLMDSIHETLLKTHNGLKTKVEKVTEIQAEIEETGNETKERNLLAKQQEVKIEIKRARRKAIEEVQLACSELVEQITALDELKGEDVNDDIKLLTSGIPLTERDIEAIVRRNADNVTMQQLAYRYARDNGIKMNSYFIGHSRQIQSINEISHAVEYTERYLGEPDGWSVITSMGF